MDNVSIHHNPKVLELLAAHGVSVLFLPPYSPSYNPIEIVFSKLKKFIERRGQELGQQGRTGDEIVFLGMNTITQKDIESFFKHCGYNV